MAGFVYFLLNPEIRAVKVGWAADPRKRVSAIQVASPHKLTLEATVPGTIEDEQALHRALRSHKMSGEWFQWNLETHELIERAQAGAPLAELLDFASGKLFSRLAKQIEEQLA
jgi:hypothetical protein